MNILLLYYQRLKKREVVQVAQYESDTSDEEVVDENHGRNGNERIPTKKYYIPAPDLQSITQASIDKYENKRWTTFNQFKKSFDIWCMEMEDGSDWKTSKCNCPAFFKNYICKHAVGMAIRLKYCKPPAAAKTVPIGEKRKRGRPAKAKPALLIQ